MYCCKCGLVHPGKNKKLKKIMICFLLFWQLDVIGIDEAQFLMDLVSFCQFAADYEGKTLIIAGLDGDFLRFLSFSLWFL